MRLAHVAAFASSTYSTVLGRYVHCIKGGKGGLVTSSRITLLHFKSHKTNSVFDLGHMFGSEHAEV